MTACQAGAEVKYPVLSHPVGTELCTSQTAPSGSSSSSTGLKHPGRGWGNSLSTPNDLFIQQLLQEQQSVHPSALPSTSGFFFFLYFLFLLFVFFL